MSETYWGRTPESYQGFDAAGEHLYPYNILLERIDGVIGEWRTLAKSEPWSAIPGARLIDALPEILPKIFKLAGMGAAKIDGELSEVISEAHGYFRRVDGIEERRLNDPDRRS